MTNNEAAARPVISTALRVRIMSSLFFIAWGPTPTPDALRGVDRSRVPETGRPRPLPRRFFPGGGAPPPPRTDADASPRIPSPRLSVAAGASALAPPSVRGRRERLPCLLRRAHFDGGSIEGRARGEQRRRGSGVAREVGDDPHVLLPHIQLHRRLLITTLARDPTSEQLRAMCPPARRCACRRFARMS